MKEIPLTQNRTALVDEGDFESLSKYTWRFSAGYAVRSVKIPKTHKNRTIYMHRQVLKVVNGEICDHKNGNGLDNRKENLRRCTVAENCRNRNISTRNKSGHKGVSWQKRERRWYAQICVNGRTKTLGYFKDKSLAAQSYNEAAVKYFGEFACVNNI